MKLSDQFTLQNTFVFSDAHCSHNNLLLPTYDHRPFETIEKHDEHFFNQVSTLPDASCVINLGDLSMGGRAKCQENYQRFYDLVDKKRILLFTCYGNHDNHLKKFDPSGFQILNLSIEKQSIVFSHYPIQYWEWEDGGAWHIYGHTHRNLPEDINLRRKCVSWNVLGYKFISLAEIKKEFDGKDITPRSRHGRVSEET